MNVPIEEAHLILSGWREKHTTLHIRHQGNAARIEGEGVVLQLSPTVIEVGGDGWSMFFPFGGGEFTFSDPREIPNEKIRRIESSRFDFGVSIRLPSGETLTLLARKEDED